MGMAVKWTRLVSVDPRRPPALRGEVVGLGPFGPLFFLFVGELAFRGHSQAGPWELIGDQAQADVLAKIARQADAEMNGRLHT